MNTKTKLENRLNEIEKELSKINHETKRKSKFPKLILTSVFVIEKLWRLIKHYFEL